MKRRVHIAVYAMLVATLAAALVTAILVGDPVESTGLAIALLIVLALGKELTTPR